MKDGLVIRAKYGVFDVKNENEIISCKIFGTTKKKQGNPIGGDYVSFDENEKMIKEIKERKNSLIRPSVSNIDLMLVIFSLREPDFSYHLALKYFTYINKYNIPASLVLTKMDKNVPNEEINKIKDTFNKLGINVYVISNKTKEGLAEVKALFKDKITALCGQSGVGKSSLLNAIDENYKRSEGEYSSALGRGKHETKETILLPYEGGYIADTPGFSSLDLELYKEDLAKFFPSFMDKHVDCYFSNCLHISEKRCVIKEALLNEEIPQIAYDTYLKLSEEATSYIRRFK